MKREGASRPAPQARDFRQGHGRLLAALALVCALALGACTNNRLSSTKGQTEEDPATGDGAVVPNILSRVVRSAQDAAGSFDLVGDGTGALGQYCVKDPSAASTNPGASTCKCSYSWYTADGRAENIEVDTSYYEGNLIRCPYTGERSIPSNVQYVKVKIHFTRADLMDTYSNEIKVMMNGSGVLLDTSDPGSFARVQRYQCRNVATVFYLLDPSNIYDPIQSEDKRIAMPLNFYTTNMGGTLSQFAAANINTWDCPAIPNDTRFGLDLRLFSHRAEPTNGSNSIFPAPSTGFDRHTFHLAKKATGVFNVPVNAYMAPTILTGRNEVPPLGYGASPIPLTGGGERCPDTSVTIPTGYQWAKLWLFRHDFANRTTKSSNGMLKIRSISCNPGTWPGSTAHVYKDCVDLPSMSNLRNNLAARVLGGAKDTEMCVRTSGPFNPCNGDSPGCTTEGTGRDARQYSPGPDGHDYSSFALGTDIWVPANQNAPSSCGNPSQPDFLNLCKTDPPNVPHDTDLQSYDLDSGNTVYDFLFVVTPTSMMSDTMGKGLVSSWPYRPYRFRPGDCESENPDFPAAGDCLDRNRLNYEIKFHDVLSNGDAPSGTARNVAFPVCVLQPVR